MSRSPRKSLAKTPDAQIDAALGEMSWSHVKERIAQMDHCATERDSASGTLIASLVERLVDVHGRRPKIPQGQMSVTEARKRWNELRRQAAASGDPNMLDAVQKFEGVADLMLNQWGGQ
ncbi:hypothetical protein GQE99_14610 [Maritimibacter sp. DP07]|uniref:Uncharacterized protein n=1 Tax=Maritimibacter harenae TaxID=2606218 RepID=A0A845M4V8_9RHOB|nr:hypothetical protein [Maritimibacter harenae]MZR14252.1 hypothetical protein [Maritimibacter harenae]